MLIIRLARIGKKKQAYFRIIVSEKTKDTHGDYLEMLGSVNPHTEPRAVQLKRERIKYWLAQGAVVSPVVHNILVDLGVIQVPKKLVWKIKQKPAAAPSPVLPAAAAPVPEVAPSTDG